MIFIFQRHEKKAWETFCDYLEQQFAAQVDEPQVTKDPLTLIAHGTCEQSPRERTEKNLSPVRNKKFLK